ncbi:MAG TPA: choice-of-anchor P family protein [Gemmatimonadales bacterium]|nr:choice-of-anchor P family protein [Gemmatimonadales bacterium]
MTTKFLVALTLLAGAVQAQTVTGKAFGTYVNAPGVTSQSPIATLPSTGGMATGQADAFGVAGAVDAQALNAVTTGVADNKKSGAQSTSELEQVSAAGGAITADVVTAVATAYFGQFTGGSDGEGSGFANLAVNGQTITTEVAPNTQVDLPGVGYAILNEQLQTGNGLTSYGITVNMIHVVLQDALGLTTGEIIIGSASSSVAR